jgi:subtilisin family serine protease
MGHHPVVSTTLGILAMFLSVFSLWAQTSQSPEGLYDAGDYYVLRDQSIVPLLRSAQEIAVRRAKTVPNQDILRASGADRVLESFDACGATTTHQIEIYSVRNITAARSGLGTLDGVMWVSPVLSVPDSGKRLLLSDQIIVQFEDESVMNGVADDVLEELASRGFEIARPPLASAPGQYLLRFDHWDAELAFAEAVLMARVPGVAWAEPNFIVDLDLHVLPNDPYFPWQQGLHNTGQNGGLINADVEASEAWDIRTGNDRLVIAIIDTGVDTGHPDLRIFRNEAEWGDGREANGVDNDGNGYADDYQGWDFYGNDNNPNPGSGPNTTDGSPSHGTACAGVAGAIGNNGLGIAGAVWKCRILPPNMLMSSAVAGVASRCRVRQLNQQ